MRRVSCLAILAIAGCAAPPSPAPVSVQPAESPSSTPVDSPATPAADARLVPLEHVRGPAPQADGGGRRGSASLLLGFREMDDDFFWEPLDQQGVIGFDADVRPGGFPLGVEFGLQFSVDEESDYQGSGVDISGLIGELYAGPRLTAELGETGSFRPYVGAGATVLGVYAEGRASVGGGTVSVDDDDSSLAGYAHAGFQADLFPRFHLGVDLRGVFGSEVELFGATGDADYVQLALLLGTSW